MAKITDPSDLNEGIEIVFDTTNKTIQLLVAGNLSADGVTGMAVYNFCRDRWKTGALITCTFPIMAITGQKFDLVNGWDWKDVTTRNLIRNAGWCLRDADGVLQEEYMGLVILGSKGGGDQVYYYCQQAATQAVKVYGDATHGDFDYRSCFKHFTSL